MRRTPLLCGLIVLGLPLLAVEPDTGPAREEFKAAGGMVAVSNKKEIPFKFRDGDADVKTRELWYADFDGNAWGPWQKHGIVFDRDTPIVWTPPEGHWKVYIRVTQVSGLAADVPDEKTVPHGTFIIDRTAPEVTITAPLEGAKLRAGVPVTIVWKASDAHLHSTPVTLKWLRDSKAEPVIIAENIKNTGSFEWMTPTSMTNNGTLLLEVTDKTLNVGQTMVKGITIDAIVPQRSILGPSISAKLEISLQITALDAGPAGLEGVKLWYSQDNGQTWVEGPGLDQAPFDKLLWSAPANGVFLLNLQGRDLAGNQNDAPKGADAAMYTIIVDTEAPKVVLANTTGVRDVGDDQKRVRSVFKPSDQVTIPVRITDANLIDTAVTYQLQVQENAPWQVLAKDQDPTKAFSFELPNVGSDTCRIKVTVKDKAGNVGEAVSSEVFRIDNKIGEGQLLINLDP